MNLVDALRSLNRKERFHLLSQALTGGFKLNDLYRTKLERLLKSRLDGRPIPQNAYVAMDYHLDWVVAAFRWLGMTGTEIVSEIDNIDQEITGSQTDIDLMVAFSDCSTSENDSPTDQIILVEAKGIGGWNVGQLKKKRGRLKRIVALAEENAVGVHLVLTAPSKKLSNAALAVFADENELSGLLVDENGIPTLPYLQLERQENDLEYLYHVKRVDSDGSGLFPKWIFQRVWGR